VVADVSTVRINIWKTLSLLLVTDSTICIIHAYHVTRTSVMLMGKHTVHAKLAIFNPRVATFWLYKAPPGSIPRTSDSEKSKYTYRSLQVLFRIVYASQRGESLTCAWLACSSICCCWSGGCILTCCTAC